MRWLAAEVFALFEAWVAELHDYAARRGGALDRLVRRIVEVHGGTGVIRDE